MTRMAGRSRPSERIGKALRSVMAIALLGGAVSTALAMTGPLNAAERFDYDEVRVEAFVRESLVDMGLVAQFKNFSGQTLERCFFAVEGEPNFEGRTSYGPVIVAMQLYPNQLIDVGWIELDNKWLLLPNDVFYLRCDNYSETSWTVPGDRAFYVEKWRQSYR